VGIPIPRAKATGTRDPLNARRVYRVQRTCAERSHFSAVITFLTRLALYSLNKCRVINGRGEGGWVAVAVHSQLPFGCFAVPSYRKWETRNEKRQNGECRGDSIRPKLLHGRCRKWNRDCKPSDGVGTDASPCRTNPIPINPRRCPL
jgi:hypothetical protein